MYGLLRKFLFIILPSNVTPEFARLMPITFPPLPAELTLCGRVYALQF
jgi:hypothetical protein